MKYTNNFRFKKPEPLDTVNVNDFNDSFDLIDEELKKQKDNNDTMLNNERERVLKEKERLINEENRLAEFTDIKKDYDTYKNVMIAESNVAALQSEINKTNSQLEQKANDGEVRKKSIKLELEDMSANTLKAISGNASLNLLSIPQDISVTTEKLSYDLNKSLVVPVLNIFSNGDFNKGITNWTAYGSTNTVASGILTNKTYGNSNFSSVIQNTTFPLVKGNKLYFEAKVRVTNSLATSLRLSVRGTTVSGEVRVSEIANPIANQWYVLKGFVTVTTQSGNVSLYLNHHYASAISDNIMEVEYITGIDTSSILGAGNEPNETELNSFLSRHGKRWFEGNANWFSAKGTVTAINSIMSKQDEKLILSSQLDWKQNGVNLLNYKTMDVARLKSGGALDFSYDDCHTSDFMPVKPNTEYCLYMSHGIVSSPVVVYYDAEKIFISEAMGIVPASYHRVITTPSNAKYMKYAIWLHTVNSDWKEHAMVVEGNTYPTKYIPYLSSENNISGSITNSLVSLSKVGFNEIPQFEIYDHYKYPLYPVWGHEYMYSWYEKLFNNANVKMVWAGDSTTMEGTALWDGYRRYELGAKILRLGGYDSTKITTIRKAQGSSVAGSWIGVEDAIHYVAGGQLDTQMAENPDILFVGYGVNDARYNQTTLTIKERAEAYERYMREGLMRIRGNVPQPSGVAYNKSADELAVVLMTPITTQDNITVTRDWFVYVRFILQRLAREFHCGFVDVSARHYDHNFSSKWSANQTPPYPEDGLHPTPITNADWTSMMADLIFPLGLHKEK